MIYFANRILTILCVVFAAYSCSDSPQVQKLKVAEGFQVEMVAGPGLVDYPMFATLDNNGRLFVFESIGNIYETSQQAVDDPQFRIKLLQDQDMDGRFDKATVFADKLSFPQGGVFIDGSLIASSAPDLLKLTDTNGDGVADEREVLLSGWVLNVNANSLIGPFLGPDGWLYMTSAIEGFDVISKEGVRLKGETARIWKVRPDGTGLQWVSAGGMNNPVELTFTPAGELLGTQTFFVDPQRGVRDAITYWTEGGIYGKKSSVIDRDSLPRTGGLLPVVNQYSRVAPVGIEYYRSGVFGGDFKNNLFSTQFNTHQVVRHQLDRNGASFSLKDEVFLWTDNTDFHPTDILEDGDGSLLMVETGGWFILGCPLSQVSKPQLKGAIYRISKSGNQAIEDPYGKNISWETLENDQLAVYLEDPRPFVADKAQQTLIGKGDGAIGIFSETLEHSGSGIARLKSVFGLYRIDTETAIDAILPGFGDRDLNVQLAVARVAGLARETSFIPLLVRLLSSEEPSLKRQAATALGQIGSAEAVEALMSAAGTTKDRFVQHAITYALITIDAPKPLLLALDGASDELKTTILMALDHMPSGNLIPEQVLPYLEQPELEAVALRVAARHPEWSAGLVEYLENKIYSGNFSGPELDAYGALISNYCGTAPMQRFLEEMVSRGNDELKALALDNMGNCPVDPLPEAWRTGVSEILKTSSDPVILTHAVALVNLRALDGFTPDLKSIAENQDYPASLRISAIEASVTGDQQVEDPQFSYLCSQLVADTSPIVKQQAAAVLTSAGLNQEQLSEITAGVLPRLDPFLLPRLLPAFETATNLETGEQLVDYLSGLPSLDNYTEAYLEELFSNYPAEIQTSLGTLISQLKSVRQKRFQRIEDLEQLAIGGSEERGRALYFGKAICGTCHTVREGGGTLGPDLTSIQKDRAVHDIIEAIVYPSVSFVREFETYQIKTASDEFRGIIKEQTPEMILLETAPGSLVRIPLRDIQDIEQQQVSMMPQGLDKLLSEEEFKDLMAYLMAKDLEY